MRYEGNFKSNFMNAVGSNDTNLQRDILLDQIASLIKNNPQLVADALIASGFKIADKNSKVEIINAVSKAIYSSPEFQNKIAELIVASNFSNATGFFDSVKNFFGGSGDAKNAASTAAGVASNVNPVNAVANAIGAIFNYGAAQESKKQAESDARNDLIGKIFGDDNKNSAVVPFVIIGSVLLIGGILAIVILKDKK